MLRQKNFKTLILINLFLGLSPVMAQETLTWTNDIPVGGWPATTLGPHSNTTLCHSRGTFTSTVLNPLGITFAAGQPSNNTVNNNSIIHGISGVPDGQGISQTFSFGHPVENLSFSIFDIDGATGNWQDRLIVTATLTGTSIPITIVTCPPAAGTVCTGSGTTTAQIDAGTTRTNFTAAAGRGDFLINGALDSVTVQYQNHTVPTSSTQFISLTELTYNCAIIGVAKVMTRRAGQAVGVSPYIVDIDFNFENFGDVTLSNLTSLEDLDAVFNVFPNVGNYTVTSITKTSGPATFTANAGFDGSATQELIGAGSSLLSTETASIRVTLNVNNYDSYVNTVTVNGTTPQSATTSDDSTDGTDSDGADGDNNPDESTPSTLDVTLLPVSLNYFSAQNTNGQIHLEWQTDIEFDHLGFEIYQENENGSKNLTAPFISQENTKLDDAVKTYSYTINSENNLPLWIADINNKGQKTWHGPFKINSSTGNKISNSKINWAAVKQSNNTASSPTASNINALEVAVNSKGMQRITYTDLVQVGIELSNMSPQNISIDLNGKNIPVYINGNKTAFDSTTSFDFYATNIEDSLYTNTRVYKLSIKTDKFKHIQANNQTQSNVIDSWYWQTEHYNPNLIYDFSSPTNDPWRADKIATFADNNKTIEFPLDELSPLSNDDITLRIEVSGGIDYQNPPDIYPTDPNRCGANHLDLYPGMPNDHCVELSINQKTHADIVFDGLKNHITSFQLEQTHAASGLLEINLKTPGDTGYAHDLIHVEDIAITYPRRLTATENRLEFQLAESDKLHNDLINQMSFENFIAVDKPLEITQNLPAIKIDGFNNADIIAYSLDAGHPKRIQNIASKVSPLGFSASIPAIALSDKYWLSTQEALLKPSLSPWKDEIQIKDIAVDYIIISHPDFIETAQQLANLHSSNGLSVKIVDINDIYNQFSDSIVDPLAIKDFIKHTNSNKSLSYVLLIGADNYDYKGYLSAEHFSHIPSIYSAIDDIVRYAPADSLYTDLDEDNISDIAIGRLPVRTVQELQLLINKELEFVSQTPTTVSSQFITDKQDDSYSYTQIGNELHALVPQWNILTANRDDYLSEANTKQQILDNFSQNPRLTTYLGHSGPRNWFSFPSAFTYNDIIDVDNSQSPSVVMQWGCWNSYYVEPEANTMAHRFLFSNDKGAVAVFGASALTSVKSEKALAALILPELAKPEQTIGQAMLVAKKQLAEQGDYRDVVIGWNLLGDPALKLIYTQD
jgi:hypothetical protein